MKRFDRITTKDCCSLSYEMYHILIIVCSILAFIPAIVFHEVMHGLAAYLLGDKTAASQGRLSLNPLKHIDPFGTVILPLLLILMGGAIFGYAKPVPYSPRNFKNPRMGDLIVGLAGPFGNFVLALLGAFSFAAIGTFIEPSQLDFMLIFYGVYLPLLITTNLYLMFFNLLPIPPLDGSSIFALIVPKKYLPQYYRMQRYALPVFLVVLFLVPYVCHVDIIGIYLQVTAGKFASFLMSI